MRIIKSDNFDKFVCSAGACPTSCCSGGWQIMIDDNAIDKYTKDTGDSELNKRLAEGVDLVEQCFTQCGNNCYMLDDDGLCSIQRALGEDALCDTCRIYPRHVEEFRGIREWSLSLSCPEAARLILGNKDRLDFIVEDTDEPENDAEYEDFDDELYFLLFNARDRIFDIIQSRELSFKDKAELITAYTAGIQECIDNERFDILQAFIEDMHEIDGITEVDYNALNKDMFSILFDLELLSPEWKGILENTWKAWDDDIKLTAEEEIQAEQLLMFWTYTYFCGAVYDGWIFSKAKLAICSTWWIFEINKANVFDGGIIEAAYRFAREIEHSDENLNALEEYFMMRG